MLSTVMRLLTSLLILWATPGYWSNTSTHTHTRTHAHTHTPVSSWPLPGRPSSWPGEPVRWRPPQRASLQTTPACPSSWAQGHCWALSTHAHRHRQTHTLNMCWHDTVLRLPQIKFPPLWLLCTKFTPHKLIPRCGVGSVYFQRVRRLTIQRDFPLRLMFKRAC